MVQRDGQVIFIRSDTLGRGDDELGYNLMMNFLHQLGEAEPAPGFVILMNAGAKLAVEGSEVIESLNRLESKGTRILVCTTCMNFFEIKDRQRVGKASNMQEITQTLLQAPKVITV